MAKCTLKKTIQNWVYHIVQCSSLALMILCVLDRKKIHRSAHDLPEHRAPRTLDVAHDAFVAVIPQTRADSLINDAKQRPIRNRKTAGSHAKLRCYSITGREQTNRCVEAVQVDYRPPQFRLCRFDLAGRARRASRRARRAHGLCR